MQLPGAYRSLARPSSALEPSYSPDGTVAILSGIRHEPDGMSSVGVWIARTHGRHCTAWTLGQARLEPFPSAVSRDGASVRFRTRTSARLPLKGHGLRLALRHGPTGIRTQGILLAKEALSH